MSRNSLLEAGEISPLHGYQNKSCFKKNRQFNTNSNNRFYRQRIKGKKRKDCLDRVLLAAEFELLKILVLRLPQNTSNVNTECAGKSKQLYRLCDQPRGALIYV